MGMTIDLALDIFKHPTDYFPSEREDADKFATSIMCKYQKIKNIICKWEDGLYDDEGLCHTEVLEMISDEVNGDGKIKSLQISNLSFITW